MERYKQGQMEPDRWIRKLKGPKREVILAVADRAGASIASAAALRRAASASARASLHDTHGIAQQDACRESLFQLQEQGLRFLHLGILLDSMRFGIP